MAELVKIMPFSSGTQFMDWISKNCDNCHLQSADADVCDLERALLMAQGIDAEMARRIGYAGNEGRWGWRCGEMQPIVSIEEHWRKLNPPMRRVRLLVRLWRAFTFACKLWIKPWQPDQGDYDSLRSPLLAWRVSWGIHHDDEVRQFPEVV